MLKVAIVVGFYGKSC